MPEFDGGISMLREIYYFSGTGNSLAVARDLANKMKAKLIPISWAMNNEDTVIIDADVTGIVFPVYHSGLPVIMRNFIEKTQFLGDPYVFAVCTYGGLGPGAAVRYLRTLIRPHGGLLLRLGRENALQLSDHRRDPLGIDPGRKAQDVRRLGTQKGRDHQGRERQTERPLRDHPLDPDRPQAGARS